MVAFEIMGLPGSTTTSNVAFMVPLEFVAKTAATGTNTSTKLADCKPWLQRQSSGRRLCTHYFVPACGSHACVRRSSHGPC